MGLTNSRTQFVNNRNRYSYAPSGTLNRYNWFRSLFIWWTSPANPETDVLVALNSDAAKTFREAGNYPSGVSEFSVLFPSGTITACCYQYYLTQYQLWSDKTTRSHQVIADFRIAERAMLAAVTKVIVPGFIADTADITDDILESLGFRPRNFGHHSPLPPPQVSPSIILKNGDGHVIKVIATDKQHAGGSRYMSRVRGIKGIVVQWRRILASEVEDTYTNYGDTAGNTAVSGETPANTDSVASETVSYDEWSTIASTRQKVFVTFAETFQGALIEFRAAYQNPRLERGPWSDIVSAVVT